MESPTSSGSPPAQTESPPPDALDPSALREELVTIVGRVGVPMRREAAEIKVDAVLAKLALYYEAAATPEVVAEVPQTYALIQELGHAVSRTIHAGAALSSASALTEDRERWAKAATNLRESFSRFMGALT